MDILYSISNTYCIYVKVIQDMKTSGRVSLVKSKEYLIFSMLHIHYIQQYMYLYIYIYIYTYTLYTAIPSGMRCNGYSRDSVFFTIY